MFSNIGQVIWDGLTYDVLKYVVGALIMSAAAQYILRAVFHRLKERRNHCVLGGLFRSVFCAHLHDREQIADTGI